MHVTTKELTKTYCHEHKGDYKEKPVKKEINMILIFYFTVFLRHPIYSYICIYSRTIFTMWGEKKNKRLDFSLSTKLSLGFLVATFSFKIDSWFHENCLKNTNFVCRSFVGKCILFLNGSTFVTHKYFSKSWLFCN